MFEIEIVGFDDLTMEEKEGPPNNGSGKEYATYMRITHGGKTIATYSDSMEPEDCIFGRDLNWIVSALKTAYELGKGDAQRLVIHEHGVFSQGIAADGPVILKHGQPLPPDEIVKHLNGLANTLAFYSDPNTYHAISFLADRPCGDFSTDFSDNEDYDYPKPGARARQIFSELDV